MVSQNPTVVHADTGELLTIRKESENGMIHILMFLHY